MPIIGDKPSTGFTQCPNHIIYDPNLSMKAKLMWIYLYSKPVNYQFSFDRIAKDMREGESTVKSTLKELETYGLLERNKLKTGRIVYNLFFKPKVKSLTLGQKPKVKKATVQKSHGGKSNPISNTDIYNNTDYINNTENTAPPKKEIKLENTKEYLNELPDISELAERYEVPEKYIQSTAEGLYNYVEAHGKTYKNYRSLLQSAINRDKAEKPEKILTFKPVKSYY